MRQTPPVQNEAMTSPSTMHRRKALLASGSAIWVAVMSTLAPGAGTGYAQAMISAPPVFPYEQAYLEASLVVIGDIVAYDAKAGASLRVSESIRGDAKVGTAYRLAGSAGYSFLSILPKRVAAFADVIEPGALRLW
jgi:hypothetical protein